MMYIRGAGERGDLARRGGGGLSPRRATVAKNRWSPSKKAYHTHHRNYSPTLPCWGRTAYEILDVAKFPLVKYRFLGFAIFPLQYLREFYSQSDLNYLKISRENIHNSSLKKKFHWRKLGNVRMYIRRFSIARRHGILSSLEFMCCGLSVFPSLLSPSRFVFQDPDVYH